MKCRLTVTGVDTAIAGADYAQQALLINVKSVMDWFGSTVSEEAKADHPYIDRTGELTRSIGYSVESWSNGTIIVNVFATAPHAAPVEIGTPTSRPYPFLYPKFYKYLEMAMQRLQVALNEALSAGGAVAGVPQR